MNTFNPSPKTVFQASDQRIKKHAALISRPEFRDALDTAMLEYCRQQTIEPTPTTGERINGAHGFISVFLELAELRTTTTHTDPDNLTQT